MSGKKGQKRRFWSDDEKRLVCAQARVPSVSVAQVARRYAMNTNLIHTWLRDPQFAPEVELPVDAETQGATFFPIEVTGVPYRYHEAILRDVCSAATDTTFDLGPAGGSQADA